MSDTTTTAPTDQTTTVNGSEMDTLRAEVDKWKALARQNENAFKKATKESEDAIQAAREEGRVTGLREAGTALVSSEFRLAFAGRDFDVDGLLETIDVNRFVNDQGQPNSDAITALADRFAPARPATAAEPTPAAPAATAFAQAPTTQPPGLNEDPLLQALKANLGIN